MKLFVAVLVSLSLGCAADREAKAPPTVQPAIDPRINLAVARAAFETNLVIQEKFETFDRIGSMSLGLPSSAAYYPFGESDRRFVLIQYEDHAKLLYQKIREDRPETIWFGMLKQISSPESGKSHSLRSYLESYGYRFATSRIPEGVRKEIDFERGYAGYALMGAVDTLVVFAIKPDGSGSASVTITPKPQVGSNPLLPITPEESEWLGFGKSYFVGDGDYSITPIPTG